SQAKATRFKFPLTPVHFDPKRFDPLGIVRRLFQPGLYAGHCGALNHCTNTYCILNRMSSCKTDSKRLTVHPEVVGCRGNQRRMGYASYNARKPDCRPGARTCSVLLRVETSRCDVPARVQRAERLAINPRSAPERRGDAAARRPYLAKQKPVPPPGATRHRQLVDARRGPPEN